MRPFAFAAAVSLAPVLWSGASAQPPSELVVDAIRFGPSVRQEGVYFTNWESSVFYRCGTEPGGTCETGTLPDDAWVMCDPAACADLEARLKALNGGPDKPATFIIVFQGRRSVGKTPKRFLHDREDKVYLEHIERLESRQR